MSLNKEFFNRPTNITAKVVCDSVNEDGVRLTTFELEYPRFIHSELMTHRMLSKNSSSSRAIPVSKMIGQIEDNMALPLYWGKNKSGMQAVEEVSKFDECKSVLSWERSFNYIKDRVNDMLSVDLHKQIPNRLLEPFQMMKVVITGTDWENFFNLRIHPDAQPEICMLAYKIYEGMQQSKPKPLKSGDYHLPYLETMVDTESFEIKYWIEKDSHLEQLTLEQAIKISAASCASVSYRTEGVTLDKAEKIFDMLIKAEVVHSSPFEHIATPIVFKETKEISNVFEYLDKVDGVTHVNKRGDLCSGNLRGWIQYRHLLLNNTNWSFDFDKRMELFVD